jgi:uncharacterized protein (PEP-CTERM system associated)
VSPEVSGSGESSKSSFDVRAQVKFNTLTDGDLRKDGCTGSSLEEYQKFFPKIDANFNTFLIGNWVMLDARGVADQNDIVSVRQSDDTGTGRNGNTNTYYRYSISPYMSRRLAGSTTYNLRYTWSQVINTSDALPNSFRHAVTTGLNGRSGPRVSWGLTGNYSTTGYDDDLISPTTGELVERDDVELKNARLKLAYQINRSWQVNGRMGWEWNDFKTVNDNADTGGAAWDIGMRWTPSSRTTVEVGQGDRFFGQTPRIKFKHESKRGVTSGSYDKQLTFQRDLATQDIGNQFGDSTSGSGTGFDQNGNALDSFGTNTSLFSTSAILDERLTLRHSHKMRLGLVQFFGSYSQQTRAEDGRQAEFGSWTLSLRPKLSAKWDVTGSVNYIENVPVGFLRDIDFNPDTATKAKRWTYRLAYRRPISTRVRLYLEYRFIDNQTDQEVNEYHENRVRALLSFSL